MRFFVIYSDCIKNIKEDDRGNCREERTFEKVINNIKIVRSKYPNLEISLNYAFINCENIYEKVTDLIEFAKENKLNVYHTRWKCKSM